LRDWPLSFHGELCDLHDDARIVLDYRGRSAPVSITEEQRRLRKIALLMDAQDEIFSMSRRLDDVMYRYEND
jgi:hypothetical protein